METSQQLVVALGPSKTVATIGAGEEKVTFHLHGGDPIFLAKDLVSIAKNYDCTSVVIDGAGLNEAVADSLRAAGLEIISTSPTPTP